LSEQISTAGMEASGTGNMKLAMNGALTIGTEDGANIEMHQAVTDKWWPFSFGLTADEVSALRWTRGQRRSWDVYQQHPRVAQVIDALQNGMFAETEKDHRALSAITRTLFEAEQVEGSDYYFVLHDLLSYYETQKKVEQMYVQPMLWAKYCLHNIAAMGRFSTDASVHAYAKHIWGLTPCPVHDQHLQNVRQEYEAHDQCRVL